MKKLLPHTITFALLLAMFSGAYANEFMQKVEEAIKIKQVNIDKSNENLETAYLAGGCYWGLEELMRKLPGVMSTNVGFSGGNLINATYEDVSMGTTGHAESIEVKFDKKILNYNDLLLYFFKIHDPTTINQQGNDKGTQYRSAIFYVSEKQKKAAHKIIEVVNQSKQWDSPVVTQINPFTNFYLAKESHQKYLKKNPKGYSCHFERKFNFLKKK